MIRQITVGGALSLGNIAIHSLVMMLILEARNLVVGANVHVRPTLRLIGIMIATVSMLMAGHIAEIICWSVAYSLLDAAPQGTDHLYFAFVNYTTLGYGDIVPAPRWRLLGPMTAMNGILLFGWSTAVIFHVLWTTVAREDFSRTGN